MVIQHGFHFTAFWIDFTESYQLLRVGTRPEKRAIDRIVMATYDFRFDKIQQCMGKILKKLYVSRL